MFQVRNTEINCKRKGTNDFLKMNNERNKMQISCYFFVWRFSKTICITEHNVLKVLMLFVSCIILFWIMHLGYFRFNFIPFNVTLYHLTLSRHESSFKVDLSNDERPWDHWRVASLRCSSRFSSNQTDVLAIVKDNSFQFEVFMSGWNFYGTFIGNSEKIWNLLKLNETRIAKNSN